jgi:IMP dehydrogenase
MGSVGAMARGSADRYFQAEVSDTHKLELRPLLHLRDRGRADIAHRGAKPARELVQHRRDRALVVTITRESPNYPSRM